MQCLQLTRGESSATTVDVVLSGTFHSSYGYVTIDGTQYTSAQTVTVAKGTSVTVYCGASSSYGREESYIRLNETVVAEGTSSAAAKYTFAADNCSIVLERASNVDNKTYYLAEITMPS